MQFRIVKSHFYKKFFFQANPHHKLFFKMSKILTQKINILNCSLTAELPDTFETGKLK